MWNLTPFLGYRSCDDCWSLGRCVRVCVTIYQHRQLVSSSLTALVMSQLTPHPQPTCLLMSSWARRASPWKRAAAWYHPTWPEEVRSTHNYTYNRTMSRKPNSKKVKHQPGSPVWQLMKSLLCTPFRHNLTALENCSKNVLCLYTFVIAAKVKPGSAFSLNCPVWDFLSCGPAVVLLK